jgi:hypothetical protein
VAIRWDRTPPAERWTVSAAEMLEMSLHHKRGVMVVDDLDALPRSPLVLAEGSTLPPAAVGDRSRAVWLSPTPEFQRAVIDEHGLPPGPRELFAVLTETIEHEASEHGVRKVVVDGSCGIEATVATVERLFADALAEGPRAATLHERRALLREANEAIVAQVRGYYARPWAHGNADEVVRRFLCECGDRSCELSVAVTVGTAAAGPVVAARHA